MHPQVEFNLALILFVPWFGILAVLFWLFPRRPRGAARNAVDAGSLLLATLAAWWGIDWSFANADPRFGKMWQQVLATSVSYGLFLLVLAAAWLARRAWLARALPEARTPFHPHETQRP